MTLNRSSYWTSSNGSKVRVKHMSVDQIRLAMYNLEQMSLEETYNDPYIVQQLCEHSNTCNILPEPLHTKDGFLLEDWHDLFCGELVNRIERLQAYINAPKVAIKKTNILVKWFKFW